MPILVIYCISNTALGDEIKRNKILSLKGSKGSEKW